MSAVAYDFNTQKQAGEESERKLDDIFSRWYDIRPATPMQQRQGIDRIFTRRDNGQQWLVEYKTDWRAFETGNAFVETISVDCRFVVGWAYSSNADYLIYLVPGRMIYTVRSARLRLELPQWTRKYPLRRVPNEGYSARGILVPLADFEKIAQQVIEIK